MVPDDQELQSPYGSDPIVEQLAEVIREAGPGGRLPSERQLALMLGVSRTALRDRLQQVEALGVLRRTVGAGTYAQDIDPAGLAVGLSVAVTTSQLTLRSLHSVRIALERQAAIEAARLADPVLLGYLARAAQRIDEADEGEDLIRADAEFHEALLRAAHNTAINFFAVALSGPLRTSVVRRQEQLSTIIGWRDFMTMVHRDIHLAVASGDVVAAARSVDDHFAAFEAATDGVLTPGAAGGSSTRSSSRPVSE
ncbi:FadR/GntR family transcriptional regulator [Pseudonocardia spinosispora]|uniref:FadR/GntR family transcriptional regulator n=1 Tax=Pseudonocardia spinosispora TaxID=103441 RepID=UPI00146F9B6C|nr:FCD domain-containing protein [Pseudonocardia spinosispora]